MKTLPRIRDINEFFERWPMTTLEAHINADCCSVIVAQERRLADTYRAAPELAAIADQFARDEFMTGHAFCLRANGITF